jgi:hypothetical protein
MTEKYFIHKCGGYDCFYGSLDHWITTNNLCMLDNQVCDTDRSEHCPYGKTIEEMAKIMAEQSLKGWPITNKTYPYLLKNKMKQMDRRLKFLFKDLLGGGGK